MYYLIYSSRSAVNLSTQNLKGLLIQSQQKNNNIGVTGMLLYFSDKFIQLLEGEETVVKSLYADIYEDTRHKNVTVLKDGFTEQRHFAEWSMGFKSLTPEDLAGIEGFTDLNDPETMNSEAVLNVFKILSDYENKLNSPTCSPPGTAKSSTPYTHRAPG